MNESTNLYFTIGAEYMNIIKIVSEYVLDKCAQDSLLQYIECNVGIV